MLSDRLKMVADMVKPCNFIADIGTDHAYLPIYLIKNNIIKYAVAVDISKGSCQKALNNVTANGLNSSIDVRCGDGLSVMAVDEVPDTIVIAGMGGMLAINALNTHICGKTAPRIVLQVQRDIYAVRKHLHNTGYKIIEENILREDGKIYIAMAAVKGADVPYSELDYHFGRLLLKEKNLILKEYIIFENNKIKNVLLSLADKHSKEIEERKNELKRLYDIQREALECL